MALIIKKRKGFTILEAIVAIALISVIFIILADVFIGHNRIYNIETANTDAQIANRRALEKIETAAKNAHKIITDLTIDSITYTTGTETLILEIPSLDSQKNIIMNTYDHIVIFKDQSNQALLRYIVSPNILSTRPGENTVIDDLLEKIIFTYNNSEIAGANSIRVYISSAKNLFGFKPISSNSTSVSLRND